MCNNSSWLDSHIWQAVTASDSPVQSVTNLCAFVIDRLHFHTVDPLSIDNDRSIHFRTWFVLYYGWSRCTQLQHTSTLTHSLTHTYTLCSTKHWTADRHSHWVSWGYEKPVNGERQEDTNTEFYTLGCINKQKLRVHPPAEPKRWRRRRSRAAGVGSGQNAEPGPGPYTHTLTHT